MKRWIMHVDMDAFFASVEQLDHPEYRGKPVIVGGQSERGVVSTCSYEARKFGVRSAMSMVEAHRRCPQAIFVQGRMSRYVEVSRTIMAVFREFSPCIEPLSVDEAFLDMTGITGVAEDIAKAGLAIKTRIKEKQASRLRSGLHPTNFWLNWLLILRNLMVW